MKLDALGVFLILLVLACFVAGFVLVWINVGILPALVHAALFVVLARFAYRKGRGE